MVGNGIKERGTSEIDIAYSEHSRLADDKHVRRRQTNGRSSEFI